MDSHHDAPFEKASPVVSLLIGGLVGVVVGRYSSAAVPAPPVDLNPPRAVAQVAAQPPRPPLPSRPGDDSTVVYKVPVGDAFTKGSAEAKVTIVTFSDFQCPFCSKVVPTVDKLTQTFGADLRIAFKHNPLPFHDRAPAAAKAAIAAGRQGKFFEMHDRLFANQRDLSDAAIEGHAQALGLDLAKWKADVASPQTQAQIDADQKLARELGATGTPAFFINGHKLVGAQPYERFEQIVKEQLAVADAKLKGGTPAARLYDALIADGQLAPAPQAAPGNDAPPAAAAHVVETAAFNPSRGPKDAPVSIVMWSDFQCPFCSRVEPTLKQVEETYGGKVRIVWRNEPLPFHNDARPAAKAAMAAHKQGKFWAMHEKLFANQRALGADAMEGYAKEIGLDLGKWKADMASSEIEQQIADDEKVGQSVGANGTPTFFINGRELGGAQPFPSFKALIDDELQKAEALARGGAKAGEISQKLMLANAQGGPKAAPQPSAPAAPEKADVNLDGAPVRGNAKAPITIVEFSDFECPFCSRGYETLNQVEKEYAGKVKVAFKHYPLPFHSSAMPAARAAYAAQQQGKFWEFYDRLFQNQRALSRNDLEAHAKAIGLDMAKFTAALDAPESGRRVETDMTHGSAAGVSGTPTFFINGQKLVGAQPIGEFKRIIDAELQKAGR